MKTCVIYPFIPKGSLPKRVDEETVGKPADSVSSEKRSFEQWLVCGGIPFKGHTSRASRWWLVAPSDSAGSCLWLAAEMLYLACGVGGIFSVNCPGRRPWVVCISAVVIHGGWSVAALQCDDLAQLRRCCCFAPCRW